MSGAHSNVPVTLVNLLGVPDVSEIVEAMKSRQSAEGLVGAYISNRFRLRRGARASLDARIFQAAVISLEQDVAGPLATLFSKREEVRNAAAASIRSGNQGQTLVMRGIRGSALQTTRVVIYFEEAPIATIAFRLAFVVELGDVAVVVRDGALGDMWVKMFNMTASISLEGQTEPLWQAMPSTVPEVHLVALPPVRVPLVPMPRNLDSATKE